MSRRVAAGEPDFGSDSFLDVTANLVGVLIILIVLVGLRVAKAPPRSAVVDAEIERRFASVQNNVSDLEIERITMQREVEKLEQGLSAKQEALKLLRVTQAQTAIAQRSLEHEIEGAQLDLRDSNSELVEAQSRLVSLKRELQKLKAAPRSARKLVHQSPVSQRVDSHELQFELVDGRVSFIDLAGLLERARVKARTLESELRLRGRASAEVGPVGAFRLQFTMTRENLPFSQSLFYSSGSFHARLVEWQIRAAADPRGEPIDRAIQPDSELERVLARHSPNKYAITIWTYADSFGAYRRIRDHLADRGYLVASRPLPLGFAIRASEYGSQSYAQ